MNHFTDALFEDLLQGLEDLELYFLSPDNMNGKVLSPRIPENFLIKNGYEDGETPRVCFAKSIDGALMALSQNLKGKELFVHQPVKPDFNNIVEPSLEQVPDVKLTTEVWYTDDIEVKTIDKILVEEDDGLPGHKYTYGDNEAELYGWKWKWLYADTENLKESASFEENLETVVYKDISDLDHYKKSAKEILGSAGGQSDNGIMDTGKEIYIDDKLVGYISFEDYDDVEGYNKVLGFGNFMILERGKGYGTQVIQNLVTDLKDEYDLIYCFVDADNSGAINLYKKLGKVYDEDGPNDNGQYYVTFWDKNETED